MNSLQARASVPPAPSSSLKCNRVVLGFLIVFVIATIVFVALYACKATPKTIKGGGDVFDLVPIFSCGPGVAFQGKAARSWFGMDMIPANGKGWSSFEGPDPTHGLVTYGQGIPDVNDIRSNYYGSTTDKLHMQLVAVKGLHVSSVRMFTQQTFDFGMFIIDVDQIPYAKYVWPAFWTNGMIEAGTANAWPSNGEYDIIESGFFPPSPDNRNLVSLHTSPGFKQTEMIFNGISGDCALGNGNTGTTCGINGQLETGNTCPFLGCSTKFPVSPNGTGKAFTDNGGGIFVMQLNCDGTSRMYFVPCNNNRSASHTALRARLRASADISLAFLDAMVDVNVDKVERMQLSTQNPGVTGFRRQQVTLNTTLCGDAFDGLGRQTCNNANDGDELAALKKTPEFFTESKWIVNSISVYQ